MLVDENGVPTEEVEVPGTEEDHVPTDEELSAAFDEFIGEKPVEKEEIVEDVVVEQPPTETIEETPEQIAERVRHSEESRLGRRLSYIEKKFEDISNKILTKDDLESLRQPSTALEDDIEDITNVHELDRFVSKKLDSEFERKLEARERRIQEQRAQEKQKYQDDYLASMKQFLDDVGDEETARKIYKEMLYNPDFNVRHSNNPIMDSSRNFQRAYRHISSNKQTTFKNRAPEVPNGVTPSSSAPSTTTKKLPRMEKDALEFMRSTGMTEEEVIEALEGEMPINLGRI